MNHVVIGDGNDSHAARFGSFEYLTGSHYSVAAICVTVQVGGGPSGRGRYPAGTVYVDGAGGQRPSGIRRFDAG